MTRIWFMIIKTVLLFLTATGIGTSGFAPFVETTDLTGKVTEPGDQSLYLQIEAQDAGWDSYLPGRVFGGYRYGPSMILNADGSLDRWSATNGTFGFWDVITYSRAYDDGRNRTKETVAVKPTSGTRDELSTCDPGVIKFGGYYYVGYTSTMDERGVDNDIYVARSVHPDGPFEKWTGSGWGVEPFPLIDYDGNPDEGGALEPSFVLMGNTLYIYYNWNGTMRVATADATDENWPATLKMRGDGIPADKGDSKDVKYVDALGRFVAVFTSERFAENSYISVWESFDGIHFRQSGLVKKNTVRYLHNCGISGRSDGHICEGDPVYLSYGYGTSWGTWATRTHRVTLSLAKKAKTDPTTEENLAIEHGVHKERAVPEVITIAAQQPVYTVEKSKQVMIYAYDSDNFNTPILLGVKFSGYDRSIIRIVCGRIFIRGTGETRVTATWKGYTCDFVVKAVKK